MKDIYGKEELANVPLEDTKWRVNSPEESKALQEWLFGRGIEWNSGDSWMREEYTPYFYVEGGVLLYDELEAGHSFNDYPHKEMVPFFSSHTGETQLVAVAPASAGWRMNEGRCPYIQGTKVDVIYNDGKVNEGVEALTPSAVGGSCSWRTAVSWFQSESDCSILAHKPHTTKQKEERASSEGTPSEKSKEDVKVGDILRGSGNSDWGFTPETRLKVINNEPDNEPEFIGVEWLSGPCDVVVTDDPDEGGKGWTLTKSEWEYLEEERSEAPFPVPGSFIEAAYPESYSKWVEVFYVGKDGKGKHVIQSPAGELKSVELSQIRPLTSSKEKEQEALVEAVREKYNLLRGFSMDTFVSKLAKDGWLQYPE